MWSLIMTVYLGSGNTVAWHNSSFAMTSVLNFQSEQACRIAGATQEVALRNDLKIDTSKKYTFICVKGE